ncbi:hypothetical protein [Mucilaginibacter sp. NFX135]|uniref:hypothetical protein n=1 Tax=Mucilaginibacter sp. NFX135 TaxID=3402687 RepID=UPI003AFB3A0E
MEQNIEIEKIVLQDDGTFPNSHYPVLLYKGVLDIPMLFPAIYVKHLFEKNSWSNSWDAGVFEYHHYHSITHEVLGIYKGRTKLQLGGSKGPQIFVEKGDVLIIPAGVAHKNLGAENSVGVIGAYPYGRNYDMNYGKASERPGTDKNISKVPLPATDPIGLPDGLTKFWK